MNDIKSINWNTIFKLFGFNDYFSLNVSFVGRNLWMIYNKAPFDPEVIASTGNYYQGIDYFMQPSLRNIGFSLRVEF